VTGSAQGGSGGGDAEGGSAGGGTAEGGSAAGGDGAERTAALLLRCYPASWRARYGAEFTELLLDEFAERPRNWQRTADVIRGGLMARLTAVGLTSHLREPQHQIRISLATLGCALAAFLTFGVAMLAQLAIGWQWATPRGTATSSSAVLLGTVTMAACAGCLGVLGLLGGLPLAWCTAARLRRSRQLAWWTGLVVVAAAVLLVGAHHFQNAWPGTGGTAAHRGMVPGGLAAFGWASTLSVSSYWAHPGALHAFPRPEFAWMLVSPLALIGLAVGVTGVLRGLRLSPRLLAYQARLAAVAALAMCGFFAGAACWVLGQGGGAAGLFHAGAIDLGGLAVMLAALAVGVRAASGARRAALVLVSG
jgi:hypothetical protein